MSILSHEQTETFPGIPMDRKIDSCPHCGGDSYYVVLVVSGRIREHHRFDHRRADNVGMWDSAQTRQLATIHCSDCERPIARASDVPKRRRRALTKA